VLSQQQEPPSMTTQHINQNQLAERWNLSPRTLESWRWLGEGPPFLKLGGRVVYRIEDVEAHEAAQLRDSTAAPLPMRPAA
jgi:hypothetical protein